MPSKFDFRLLSPEFDIPAEFRVKAELKCTFANSGLHLQSYLFFEAQR